MKHLVITTGLLALLATTLISVCSAAKSHNLIIGSRMWGDRELHKEVIKKDYSWFGTVKKQQTFTGDGISKITQIKAIDQARNGKGANVILLGGGPGQSFATLKFVSQSRNPINFIVEIYGRADR